MPRMTRSSPSHPCEIPVWPRTLTSCSWRPKEAVMSHLFPRRKLVKTDFGQRIALLSFACWPKGRFRPGTLFLNLLHQTQGMVTGNEWYVFIGAEVFE